MHPAPWYILFSSLPALLIYVTTGTHLPHLPPTFRTTFRNNICHRFLPVSERSRSTAGLDPFYSFLHNPPAAAPAVPPHPGFCHNDSSTHESALTDPVLQHGLWEAYPSIWENRTLPLSAGIHIKFSPRSGVCLLFLTVRSSPALQKHRICCRSLPLLFWSPLNKVSDC